MSQLPPATMTVRCVACHVTETHPFTGTTDNLPRCTVCGGPTLLVMVLADPIDKEGEC